MQWTELADKVLVVRGPARPRLALIGIRLSRTGNAVEAIDTKRKAVLERIESLERSIRLGTEYLQSGKHAKSQAFRPWFGRKGDLPPHKDWVKNVFLRRKEKALAQAEKLLQRLGEREHTCVPDNHALKRTVRAERSL